MERRRQRGEGVVLDVRGAAEFDLRHVPDALNVAHTRLWVRLGEVPKGRPVLVHCNSGGRSAAAASLLERHGYEAVDVDDLFANYRAAEAAATA
jgi:hydroxyacylglutathione hydrolase